MEWNGLHNDPSKHIVVNYPKMSLNLKLGNYETHKIIAIDNTYM